MVNLSICIPTYNRSNYLGVMLKSIISQIELYELSEVVEIVICDNNSIDNTLSLVESIKKKYSGVNINFFRNEENIGVVRNLIQAIRLSKGKYWMFYGDDDLIPNGALSQIIDVLKKNEGIPVIIFNQDSSQIISQEKRISIYECASNYYYYMGNACSACLNINRDLIINEYENLLISCWPHTHLMFLQMFDSKLQLPVFISDVIVHSNQKKDNNNILNSFYYFDSLFYSLVRMGLNISNSRDPIFYKKIGNGIPVLDRSQYFYFIKKLIFLYQFYSIENEKKDFDATLSESIIAIKWPLKIYVIPILILTKVPNFIYSNGYFLMKAIKECYSNKDFNIINYYAQAKIRLKLMRETKILISKKVHTSLINKGDW
jgi:glycosyltransferase involved in cell wall biosynthesis